MIVIDGKSEEVLILRAKEKKPINIEIGENIRVFREKAGYSREKFSELVGVSPRFIADAETGFVGVSLTNLKRICKILGISADRLLWTTNNNDLGLDEMVSHIEPKYLEIVKQTILKQLEIISIASKEENEKKHANSKDA